jgi:hypothetical protein
VVKISGNLWQSADAVITETDSGSPAIELDGATQQQVFLQGRVLNSIVFRINNRAGAVLQSPLSLSYKLDLVKGILTTSGNNLLTLSAGCMVNVDSSTANSSYISGPLRREGLSNTPYCFFPVGKPPGLQWAELRQASGNFTVEYIPTDPAGLTTVLDTSIKAISNNGYWIITADAGAAGYACFSYTGPNNAGITDMASLAVAQLSGGKWISRHNTGTTGSAGGAGSVSSEWLDPFPASPAYFTLAASSIQHALAIDSINLTTGTVSRVDFDIRLLQSLPVNNLPLLVHTAKNTSLRIMIITMQGIIVKATAINAVAGNTTTTLNLGGLAAGVYQVIAHDNRGQTVVRRFVKQ